MVGFSIQIKIVDDEGNSYSIDDIKRLAKSLERLNQDEQAVEKAEQAQLFPTFDVGAFPCKDGTLQLSQMEVARYVENYPMLKVKDELRKARQWCIDNPSKQKTKKGLPRFINGWLNRTADRLKEESRKARGVL